MATTLPQRNTLTFPFSSRDFLEPYLPHTSPHPGPLPFITLTYATSLDARIALAPGTQTILSGPESKAMTHYLRSRHDAILVGVGTAVADDPGLNCRLEGVGLKGQPRPIVLDSSGRWNVNEKSKVIALAREGKGKPPYVIMAAEVIVDEGKRNVIEDVGGKLIILKSTASWTSEGRKIEWTDMLGALAEEGIESVMIEGGGKIITSLLAVENVRLLNSVIVTIAPTWLGRGGVEVVPQPRVDEDGRPKAPLRLFDTAWRPFGEDVVMCGRVKMEDR